jgi:hypothetical protein
MHYFDTSKLPSELRPTVESEIQSGERVLWMEQPIPGRLARGMWPIVVFGIPWTAFALFWTGSAFWMTSGDKFPGPFNAFPLFGLPFILIGLGMLSSPYWARRSARRSVYILTDRRAIIFKGGLRGSVTVRSFEPEKLSELQRKQQRDGSGDLIFTQDVRRDSDGDRHTSNVGFIGIREVKNVEEMVRTLSQKSRK